MTVNAAMKSGYYRRRDSCTPHILKPFTSPFILWAEVVVVSEPTWYIRPK